MAIRAVPSRLQRVAPQRRQRTASMVVAYPPPTALERRWDAASRRQYPGWDSNPHALAGSGF